MNKKSLIYFVFFLLLVLKVIAQEDFDVTAQAKVDLCPCSNQGYKIYVENKGSLTSTYSVSFAGDAAKWVKAIPAKFSINPGAISYFFVYVNSDCNIEGSYDLYTYIKTDSVAKVIKQTLNFVECYESDIEFGEVFEVEEGQTSASFSEHIGAYSICEKEEKVLPILITNKESYGNSYILSLKGPDWAKLSTEEVNLDGNKKGLVLIELNPGEGIDGNYKLKFDAITKLGNVKKSEEIDINIDKCYGLNIDIDKEEDVVCEETSYDIKIENDGSLPEEINLSTNFDWAKFDFGRAEDNLTNQTLIKDTFVLGGNEEVILKLILEPDISGSFDVEVKGVVKEHEDIKASDKIKINVIAKEECYKAEIALKKKITNYYSEEYYNINVVNKGLKKADYNVDLEGPSWASISPNSLELSPGQKGNLNLYVNPGEDVEANTYNLILNLNFNDVIYSEDIDIQLKEESKIIKNIKNFIRYFQFYIYLIVAVVILVLIFIQPIKKQINKIKKNYEKYKIKKEKEKQREEERKKKEEEKKAREEEERKAREEKEKEEKRKRELEEKKIKEEKKTEKVVKKKFFRKYLIWFIVLFVLIIISVLVFLSIYFKWIDYSFFKDIPLFITTGLKGAWAYSYYIFIALVFLVLIILFFHNLEKEEKKKKKEKERKTKEEKKAEKRKRKKKIKFFKTIYFKISLIILILLIIGFIVYYYFYSYVKEFVILYLYYIIIGIIILILIILFMKFYKPIVDFLTKEEK